MKKLAFVLVATATFLVGCGSAQSGIVSNDDEFYRHCVDNGGTYTDFEKDGDTCTYQ